MGFYSGRDCAFLKVEPHVLGTEIKDGQPVLWIQKQQGGASVMQVYGKEYAVRKPCRRIGNMDQVAGIPPAVLIRVERGR